MKKGPSQLEETNNGFLMRRFERFLYSLESLGNKIPDPMLLFFYLMIIVILSSYFLSLIGFSAVNPITKKSVQVYNLLSIDGFIMMLTTAIKNFITLPALGSVLTCFLGVGVAEKAGLFVVGLRGMIASSKGSHITIMTIFFVACIMSHVAAGTGFVIMPALAAIIWAGMGRNPIAGMLAAYATVSGAYASNYIITVGDIINVSFTLSAAKFVMPDISLTPAITYYFSLVSAIILTVVSVFLTVKVLEPRLGTYKGSYGADQEEHEITPREKKALKYAMIAAFIIIALVCIGFIPENGVLRDPATGSALSAKAPLMQGLTLIIAILFFIPGVVFGLYSGRFKGAQSVAAAMGKAMSDMGTYTALMFLIAQFLKYFDVSNIGIIIAIKGAILLQESNFPIWIVLVLFVLMCSVFNFLIGSASAKWAILSTIFVPMFMFLGYHPSLPQMAYLIGDAVTNPLCPTDAYFAMLLVLAKKYDETIGIGTLIANMTPYAMTYLVIMTIQLLIWYFLGLPFGPGSPMMLP